MPVHKPTNRVHNKKLRRRREGLSTKSYEYGDLDGVELALFVRYPKRGDFYSYMSAPHLSWVSDVKKLMGHPKAKNELPEDVKQRVEETRRKMKKPQRTATREKDDDASAQGGQVSPAASAVIAFPQLPAFDLTILKEWTANNHSRMYDGVILPEGGPGDMTSCKLTESLLEQRK